MYSETTLGIEITVEPQFMADRSEPDAGRWFWAYTIRIQNNGAKTVQLMHRHWRITDANGRLEEVKGPGVVGEQPILAPGESFSYTPAVRCRRRPASWSAHTGSWTTRAKVSASQFPRFRSIRRRRGASSTERRRPVPQDADSRLNSAIDVLERLVAFDTESSKSNLDLVAFVETLLRAHDVPYVVVPNATGDKAAVFATIGPMIDGGVVLSGHTDVVPVTGQTWTGDPFTLRREGSRLYGRGTTDMKGFDAVCLAMIEEFKRAP